MKFKWLKRLLLLINSLVCKPKKTTEKNERMCKKELEIKITETETETETEK
jgi:hypothetical protein